ncbi:MAG: HEAT repeat domain-containing protein [Verrucomicrobia bacterium]|nr:HEAT repeat domain-containing protein [Verrucomicrobiota bacterium]
MKLLSLILLGLATFAVLDPARAAQFKFPTQTLTVPDGFEVELVAGPPLVDRPIEMDFDEQGRLYVTDSSGNSEKSDKQIANPTHRIVRLEDTDGDGRFDKTGVFADKMMFPEGALWFDGSLYVAAPPTIWKLTDTDGDGIADKREEWFKGGTITGCMNDLHGPYLGPDGFIYWCKGAFAEQKHTLGTGKKFTTRAAHIFRMRPDGTGLEPVMTGGMDNPVGVAFSPTGERFFTTTFVDFTAPGRRDGLLHAIYGGVYGKVNDVTDSHKKTGELMPVMTQLGPAAPCGLTRYASSIFGDDYRDNLFACLFNMHKVTRHVLAPDGATFKTTDSDFLVSDNPDFHPTDVIEDADGSLLVIDTGGWYKVCCPTSQLYKPDVLGAIYRVRRKDAPKIDDARGLKLNWANVNSAELVARLGDSRPAVVERVIRELTKQGSAAVPALREAVTTSVKKIKDRSVDLTLTQTLGVETRRNAVWALTRIDSLMAREAVRTALDDSDESVRHAAVHSVSVWRDLAALDPLLRLLRTDTLQVRRAASEALGRLGDKRAVPALLSAIDKPDRVNEHSLTYALVEIGGATNTAVGLKATNVWVKRAAMLALDQMDKGDLKAEAVTPSLASVDPVLKETALWIVNRHPDWGPALTEFFQQRLADKSLSAEARGELERLLSSFARNSVVQTFFVSALRDEGSSPDARFTVLRAMAKSSLKETPASWLDELARILAEKDAVLVAQAVAAARALPPTKGDTTKLAEALARVARDTSVADDVRIDALAALPGGGAGLEPELFEFVRAHVEPSKSVLTRSAAANVLAKAKLSAEQLGLLTDTIKTSGPLEVPKLLGAYEKCSDEKLGVRLVASLKKSAGLAGLRPETLKPRMTNFPEIVRRQVDALAETLNADAAKQKAHLEELSSSLKNGDIRRGQTIFNSQKAACASCHTIGYLGGKVGPDLTRIGQVRTERDLLEAIVYPSASFVRSYEPMIVLTKSGDQHNGVLRKDALDEVVLATGPDTEVRVARADIAEMRPGSVSVMPSGLDEQLSRQELADLLAFLKATRWGATD